MPNDDKVTRWRQRTKAILFEEHGGRCLDCGYVGVSYQFDFDHRDPSEKKFKVSGYHFGLTKLRAEALKCDLVCANCHRVRTHRQRCDGCDDCYPTPATKSSSNADARTSIRQQ